MPLVTEELLALGRSAAGGWTKAQLALLGVPWPPVTGWKSKVIGSVLTEGDAATFVAQRKSAVDTTTLTPPQGHA